MATPKIPKMAFPHGDRRRTRKPSPIRHTQNNHIKEHKKMKRSLREKYDQEINAYEFIYSLEKNGVKGFYTRDEVYTALEEALDSKLGSVIKD